MEFRFQIKKNKTQAGKKPPWWVKIFIVLTSLITIGPMLVQNERERVRAAEALNEIKKNIISIDPADIDPQNNDKIIHASAPLAVEGQLKDPLFHIQAHAVKLKRTVSKYQLKRVERIRTTQTGSYETYYDYVKSWERGPMTIVFQPVLTKIPQEADRQLSRPGIKPMMKSVDLSIEDLSIEIIADNVGFGSFTVPKSLLAQLKNYEPLPITQTIFDEISDEDIKSRFRVIDGILYEGRNPKRPWIGDIKIEFSIVKPSMVTIIAQQVDATFAPYGSRIVKPSMVDATFALFGSKKGLEFIMPGELSEDEMVSAIYQEDNLRPWRLRLILFIFIWVSFLILGGQGGKVQPFYPLVVVSFMAALAAELFGIGLCWFSFDPLITLLLTIIAVFLVLFAYTIAQRRKREAGFPYD